MILTGSFFDTIGDDTTRLVCVPQPLFFYQSVSFTVLDTGDASVKAVHSHGTTACCRDGSSIEIATGTE